MNFVSIIMDQNRNLLPDSYSLGVERDHGIEKIVLGTLQKWDDVDLFESTVSLHLKADNGYLYNLVCTEKFSQDGLVYFFFPINREMTCRSGKVKIEFSFDNPAVPFEFTSRSVDLMIAKPLTDTKEVESDYPGMLSDVLSAVQESSVNVLNAQKDISELRHSLTGIADATNIVTEMADNIQAFLGYDDEQILGLEADFENNTFTRLAGAKGMNAGEDFNCFSMYGGRRRCNVSDNGTIVAFYGDENYREDGTNGQVMVYQPRFYYRVVPTKLEKNEGGLGYLIKKANYYISETARMGFKLHPAFINSNGDELEFILYSAFEGSLWDESKGDYAHDGTDTSTELDLVNDRLCSVSGVKAISGKYKKLTRANLESLAKSRGDGWHIETIQAVSANQLLMLIEFGCFNTQEKIGNGVIQITNDGTYNASSLTGSTSSLGNKTGVATETTNEINGVETVYTDKNLSISYRGIENPYGNIWKFVEGINVWGDGTMNGGQLYITSKTNFTEGVKDGDYKAVGFTLPNTRSGYVSALGYGDEEFDWLFVASAVGGTSVAPIGDTSVVSPSLNGYNVACCGNCWTGALGAGGFCWHFSYHHAVSVYIAGGRLLYIPSATKGGVL